MIVAQENETMLRESKEDSLILQDDRSDSAKDKYEKLKELVEFDNIIETLSNESLLKTIFSSTAILPLLMPLVVHYYPQLPYIKQNLEMMKLLKNKK
ncbi:hypothetical protein RBU61_08170 [Tissierella sp. MB52-C2]|uniref:hypothetical protein n=1 Tax=Tissierella sp. MB52-C2 TaxID=3070999 RepID=UPI00280BFF5E|nr:hypothetical protein [Tissierella sp. MB52-C2]WMM26639.1 hypothetical protein RBU61_08170 [Tissierella sp. MB52-C2]